MILRDLMVRTGRRASQSMECLSKILRLKRSGARQLELVSMEDRLLFSAAPGPAPEAPADNAQIETVIIASLEAPIEILSDGAAEESNAVNAQGLQPLGLDVDTNAETHELVFIDTGAANYQDLLDDLWTHQDPDRHIDVVLLSSGEDGIAQITETLAQYRTEKLDAVHLVTHGADRAIKLGNTWLDATALEQHRDQIASWGESLNPGADLLIYGCDLAGNDLGRALLNNLVDLTGADIAASIDETGSALLGGDWDLEYELGDIETEVAFSELTQEEYDGLLNTFLVTSTANSGAGTLRQAIADAQALAGTDTISFASLGSGVKTINLTSTLTISSNVILDGWTAASYSGTPQIVLNGSSAGLGTSGITVTSGASGSIIRGLVIQQFTANGILLDGASNVTIEGNYIGTDVTGLLDRGNGEDGIQLQNGASINTIGGLTAAERNVISGNNNAGIAIDGATTSSNTILGNYIGIGSDGSTTLGNTHDGIHLQAATNTVIGSSNPAGRNVISGNAINGIGMDSAVGTVVRGNYIGTNAAGTAAVGNQGQGIYLGNLSTSNVIGTDLNGTSDATEGNLISGNADNGIQFWGANVSSNAIRGNIIGLNAAQSAKLANGTQGIQFGSGANSNVIGGTSSLAANVVAGNTNAGVELLGAGTSFNAVLGNFIGTNASSATGLGNSNGVLILGGASFNTIGGTTSSARNIISGNQYYGVDITGTGTNNNAIQGNYIGTNVAGTAALANGAIGVIIEAGASNNTIGGSTSARNIISGNTEYGIDVTGATTDSNVITSNYIGLDATGTTAISNGGWGIAVDFNATGTIIGGTGAGDGNVISGNTNSSPSSGRGGIYVWGSNTRIQGNTIGLNAARTAAVANGSLAATYSAGIWVNGGGTGNQIGGTTSSAANTISGNVGAGIATDTSTNTVSIQRNSIYANSGLGIDLAHDGATLNDPGDSDTGTNTLLNFPVIYSATIVGGFVTITGEARFGATVDFYESDDAAGSPGEGRTWIGSGLVSGFTAGTIDSTARQFSFTFAVGSLVSGDRVTATATLSGSTSEFSSNVTDLAPGITVTPTSGLTTTEAGGTASFTVVLDSAPTASVSIQLGSTDTTEGTISGATLVGNTLTFTTANWSTPQTITVTGVNDSLSDGDITYSISTLSATSSDLNYNGINPSDVSVTNIDNDLYTISGTIYEDVDGDGQVSDDGVGLASAIVSLYRDDGDGVLDAGDLIVNSIVANGSGQYSFTGLSNDTYWVVADSRSFIGTGGLNGGYTIHDQWAEQTYGSTGSVGWNGSAYTFTGTAGAHFGGMRSDRGDNGASLLTAEHVTRVAVASANVASVDYGFSYNVITNTRDGDEVAANNRTVQGSLRQFVQNSNALVTTQSSNFQIGTGAQAISLTSMLDNLSDTVILDATTQEGFSGTPLIVLDGNNAAGDGFHLTATADFSTIRGFVIRDFVGDAIEIIDGSDGNTIAGNYLGALTTSGTDAGATERNGESGLAISGANNTIGGSTAADRNVISANNLEGIAISGTGATGNLIVGNYIGTTATGAGDLGNGQDGILLYNGASSNTIGGVNAADRNIISGNNEGIEVTGSTTSLNVIQGNYIGLGSDGATAIGNDFDGIHISQGAHDNTIGGSISGARNVISASGANGIQIEGTGTDNNVVQGNFIGTDATGELDRGNASDGVRIGNGAQSNTIGGTTPEARNVISGNDGDGVDIQGTGTTGNVVQGNYIGTDDDGEQDLGNSSEGVDVSADGNTIGGSVAGAGNVISGNNLRGVYVTGAGVSATIQGNYVGTDKDGLQALGNSFDGIEVNFGAGAVSIRDNLVAANGQWGINLSGTGAGNTVDGNTVGLNLTQNGVLGGTGIGASSDGHTITGNTIGGSSSYGIYLTGSANNTIQGNFIGTNSTGATGLGNAWQGIGIDGANSDDNLIGGTDTGEGNVFANNTRDGIAIASGAGTRISILGNTFRSNGGLAIDLSDNGVTDNDNSGSPDDQDVGPNGLQNFPEFSSIQLSGSDLILQGDLRTDGLLTAYRLEFYGNPAGTADATNGEGRIYLGSTTVTTDSDGRVDFNVTLGAAGLVLGDSVTATATRIESLAQVSVSDFLAYGSTSEFATNTLITSANNAPTIAASSTLNSISEDDVSNSGTLVSQMVDTEVTDADAGALKGIAIISVPTTNGTWEYTLNGTTWLSVGTPSTTAALLLPADATTAIRFVPNSNFNGVSGLLNYKAWDQTSGTAGGTADVTFSGATTAFSTGTNGTSVSVSAVNDQPVFTSLDGAPTYVEGGAGVILDSNVSIFDADLSAIDDFDGATLTWVRQGGANPDDALAFDGVTVTTSGTDLFVGGVQVGTYLFTGGTLSIEFGAGATSVQVNMVMQNIVYWNNSDNPPASVQIDWTFSDGNTGAQGTGGALQATGSITVGITAVNDAPVLDNTGTMTLATITEDDIGNLGHTVASIIASAGGDRITDADAGAAEGIAVTGVWTDSGNGVWQYSLDGGSHWLLLSSAGSNSSLLLRDTDRLRFVPDEASAGSGHLTFRAWDRSDGNSAGTRVGTSSNGGTSAFSASSATASITVTALNDTPMFGIRPGVAVTALGSTNDYGRGMVLQADGKVIVAGFTDVAGTDDIALTRYNPNGTLDTSFGGGDGIVITNLGGDDQANGVVLQADGKIVVAGYSTVAGTRDFALVRYNADGTLDTSFGGGDGIVNTDLGGSDVARSVALQADGRIVVAGGGALVRYNSDGSLDTSFGGGDGIVANTSDARSVAVQADGKIVVAGFRSNGSNSDYALTRYNSDGSLDLSFGGGAGTVTTDLGGGNDYGSSVTLQPDGRIIVAGDGIGATGSRDFGLVRYNSDGTLDASFGGGDGIVTTDVQGDWDYGRAVTLQADGKIVLAGSGYRNSSEIGIQLARYNADGTLDTSFGGGDGTVTTTLGRYWDEATGVAVQADGTIVAAGYTGNSNGFAVVRYNANGTLDATFTSNRLDGTPTFTEGGAAVVLDADVAVRDADLDALNSGDGDYSGASLTLVRNAGANVQDQFSFNDGNGISLVGANLVKNGQAIASFDTTSTPGQLVIVFTNANGEVPTTADAAAVARQITYTNSSDTPPTGVSIDWTFSDGNSGAQGFGGALTASGMTTVTIISSNDAPSLVSSSTLNSINEDEFNNSGTLVSSLIATSFSDADAGALRGIAITSVNASHGAWEYTLDGTNWLSIGTPTTTASLLLAADATTAVRFIPNADYAGVSGLMDYRAWDQTTGTAGGTADTSITGGSTAFSVGINGTSVSVAAVNDAPILTAGSINDLIVQEDSGLTSLGLGGLAFAPGGGADEAGQTLTYQVTAIPHPTFFGSIYLADGTTLVSTGTYTLSQVQGMQFRPVANQNGGPSYFAFNVIDSGGTGNGGVNNTGLSIQLNITAANDAPTIATNTLTITEGATVVLANSDINATDPDTAATNLTYNASNISGGQFELVATPGSAITSFTQAQINSGAVQFVHDGGETAPSYQLTVSDGSLSHGPSTVSIGTFTNLNDAPVIAFGQGNITHTEGTSISTIDSSVSVTDIDSTDFASGTLTVTVSGGDASDQPVVQNQGTGVGQVSVLGFNISYNNGLGSVTVGTWSGGSGLPLVVTFTSAATATEVAAVARAIGFQNFSSNPSSADRTVQFQLTDGDGGTSAAATKTIHFTTVNTAPTVSGPPSVTTDVDTLVTFSLTNGNAVSVNDLDAGLNPIQVRLSVTTGSLTLSTDVGLTFSVGDGLADQTMTMTGTVAAIQAAMDGLRYTPQLGFSGADRLIIEVDDLGNSGTTSSPLTATRGVNIYVGTVPFLQGDYLEVGFNGSGSIGSTLGAPTGYQSAGSILGVESDPERDGGTYDGDFVLPGSPEEGWGVHVGGATYSNNTSNYGSDDISGTWGAVSDTGSAQSMTWDGAVGGLNISSQYTVLRDGLYLEIVVTLTNSTASTLSDLYYYRNVDPDNNYDQNSDYFTTNTIISQGNDGGARSEVTATQPDGSFVSLTGYGENSRVTYGGFSNRDPLAIYNGTGLSQTGSAYVDEAISLAFHVPTLAAGQSTTLTLRYTFGNEAAPDVDLDGNDSTASGLNYQGLFIEDGGPVAIVDSDMTLFDADNDVLQGMTITLTNPLDGVLESLAATTTGTNITASYDSGTGVLTLAGQDSVANYRHVLTSVVYDNSANTPNTTSRSITIAVSDGTHTSPVATSTIAVLATNDPPVLLTNTLTISEGGTVVLSSSNINSSDPESPATGLTYTVSNLTGGHFESIASGATITSFTQDQIDNGGIQFVHDGGEAAPTFSLTLSDGAQSVGPSAALISFSNVNDAPVTGTSAATANEDVLPITVVLGGADVDGTLNQIRVATLPANGVLYLDAAMTIPVVTGTDYATTAGQLSVYFAPTLNWNGVTTFTFAAIDNTGTIDATPATATITVNAVNDAPVVTLSTTAIEFTENNPVGLMVDLVVTDVDSATLTSATVSITANFVAGEDQLAFTNMLGITGNYNAATGVLTLTGTASLADYQTALRTITYFNPSDNPTTAARQFQVVVSDGSSPSIAVSRSININRVNDGPTISTNALTITEGATVVLNAANLQSSDPDNAPTQLRYTVASSLGGQFEFVATPGVAITSFTQDDINNSRVQFVHDGGNSAPTYQVSLSDGSLSTGLSSPTVTFNAINDAPTISSISNQTVNEDNVLGPLAFTVSDSDSASLVVTAATSDGTLIPLSSIVLGGTGANRTVTITPATNLNGGPVTITLTVSDGSLTAQTSFGVTVQPVNDPPTINNATFSVSESATNGTAVGTVVAGDIDLGDTRSFSVLSGDPLGAFAIDGTGQITVADASLLDFETQSTWTLTVQVQDAAGATATSTVMINLIDQNDNSPIIGSNGGGSSAAINVAENTISVTTVVATDADAGTTLQYSLSGVDAGLFQIDINTGVLTFLAAPDYESPTDADGNNAYQVTVIASDGVHTDSQALTISVTEIDEFVTSPVVDLNGAADTIAEDAAVGSVVGITAFADDLDATDTVSYSLLSNAGGRFAIDSITGVVTVAGALDYETSTSHTIRVLALSTDGTSTFRDFTIAVTDINEFGATSISDTDPASETLAEDLTVGSSVGVTAFADDLDGTDSISYSLLNDAGGLFTIDAVTGVVTLAQALDYESSVTHTIRVQALSTDGSSTFRDFDFTITDVNEFATTPISDLDASAETIAENTAVGTPVGITAFADDLDGTDTVSYSLLNSSGGLFAIDSVTGVVTIAGAIDYETSTSHTIRVQALSTDGSSTFRDFTIAVTDSNEFATTAITDLDPAAEVLAEDLAVGSAVGVTAFADDQDGTDTISYSLLSDAGGLFTIDATTGVVTLNAALDYETATTHAIRVQAFSTDGTSTTRDFVFVITDVNEFTTTAVADNDVSPETIAEDVTVGTTVGITAFADDLDGTDTVSYSLLSDAGGRFAVDSVTGVVTVAGAIDYETSTSHTIRVQALSTDGSSTFRDFVISVTDVNEYATTAISDLDSAIETIAEDLAVGSTVSVTAFADDLDGTDTISYSLLSDAGGLFAIDSVTGVVTLAQPLDYETSTSHTIRVQARSTDGSSTTRDFTFTVTDVNEFSTTAISDVDPALETVAEDAVVGTAVGVTAFADDLDGTDTISYSLLNDAGGRFAIDSATGVVTVAGALDYESATTHTIRVEALSTDGSSTFRDFVISVTDVNEYATTAISDANLATNSVAEKSGTGTVVGVTALADDLDGTDTVSYSLDNDANGLVAIDPVTGVVTVNGLIDFETTPQLTFTVRATSTDTSFSTQTFTVDVLDRNDNAPVVTNGQFFAVAENTANGTPVGTIIATDVDTLGVLQNWQITGGTGATAFVIDAATGEITVADSTQLNFEASTSFTLQVTVSDGVQTSSVQTVTINLTDVNERPTLVGGSFTVDENSSTGTPVGAISASDVDAGDQLSYSLVGGNNGGAFAIDPSTGAITVANPGLLDFESTTSFTLTAEVVDRGGLTHQQTVTVTLRDLNERPTVLDGTYHIPEWSLLGTSVGFVSASDVDAGDALTYRILAGNTGGRFLIDSSTGEIRLANPANFTHESQSSFTLSVEVQDLDGLTHTAQMTILVDNVNTPPTAQDDFYSLVQFEPLVTTIIDGVLVNDSDPDSAMLTLTVISGPVNGTLTLNADGSFTYSSNDLFSGVDSFTYQISDGLESSRVATVTLTVGMVAPGGGGSGSNNDNTDNGGSGTDNGGGTTDDSGSSGGPPGVGPTTTTNPPVKVATPPRSSSDSGMTPPTESSANDEFFSNPVEPLVDLARDIGARRITRAIERPIASEILSELSAVADLIPDPVQDLTLSILENHVMWNQLNSFRDDLNSQRESTALVENIVVGTTTAVSGGLTVGYVIWLIRGGSLLATMMSVMPSWISFDPLPVMDQFEEEELTEDTESLASIVSGRKSSEFRI